MKILILTVLIAAVSSGRLSGERDVDNQTQWPWQVGKLYRYEVQSHTLARLDEGASSGNAFKALFIVRVRSPGRLEAKLENPEHALVHQELEKDQPLPEDLKYKKVQDLDQPFEIFLDGGRVKSLKLPSSLSLSQENLLKGLIGALQVDLSSHRGIHHKHNNYDMETQRGQFRKMETDVTGDCETLYTVSPVASEWRRELPKFALHEDPIEITKSKSYGHCHHRVAYHFGVPKDAEWTGTARDPREEQFIDRATISRILAGKQGPIYKTETTNTVHVHPHLYGKQKAEVLSFVKLTLVEYKDDSETEWQKSEENREIQNLLYSLSSKQVTIDDKLSTLTESDEEQKVQVQDELRRERRSATVPKNIVSVNKMIINRRSDEDSSSSSSESSAVYINEDIPNNNEPAYATLYMKQNPMNAQKLVQDMAQQLHNPNNMPKADFLSKFNILVRIVSSMTYEQLSQTSRGIEVAKASNNIVKSDMWMIYRDAVAHAGTLPAFQQIQYWIEKKKIEGEEAAEVVASMVNALHFPTKETMTRFFNLAMSEEVKQQKYLNSTALIAATGFINMGHVNNDTAVSYYPTHMYGRLARKNDNFVVKEIIPRLRQILEQAVQQGDIQKAQVYIKAIGNLGHPSILEVFAPYLEGKIEVSTYLRALMVYNMKVLAREKDSYTRAVLYSILRNTAEPYEVRVAAIYIIFMNHPTSEMMQAMAQMTHDDTSVQVRAVLKSSIESAADLKYPHFWKLARTAQAAKPLLTKQKFGKQYSTQYYDDYYDSEYDLGIISKLLYTNSEDSLFPKYLKYGLKTKSFGWDSIAASFSNFQQFVDYFRQQWQHHDDSESTHKYSANKISEMLKIKRDPKNPLEAAIEINFMNQERFFTFGEDDLRKLPETTRQLFLELPKGMEKHYTKVLNQVQTSIMFPVAMGMPFLYKYKEPTVIHVQAKAKGVIKWPLNKQTEDSDSIETEIQLTYGRNLDGNVGFLDTLSNQIASVGVINKIQLSIPIKVQTQMKSGEVKIHFEPLRPDQDTTIAHYSVWPYSSSQKRDTLVPISQDVDTKVISRMNKVASIDTKFGQSTSTVFQIQGYSYSKDYKSLDSMFPSSNLLFDIVLARNQKDVALTHYNFKYLGKQSQNKRVTFTAVYDSYYNQKHEAKGPLVALKMEDVTPNSEVRRREIVKRVVSGIKTAKAKVVDLSAIFEGPQKTEYVVTAAIGNSPVDTKIQYAFFLAKNSAQSDNGQINGVGSVNKPETTSLNFLEALKKNMKMSFDADVKFGQENGGNIHIQGFTDRTKKYAEALQNLPQAKKCVQEISRNNFYQQDCHKMMVLAHTPDYFKASMTYKDVSPALKYMTYRAYRIAEHFGFWYTDMNPLKTTSDGKLEIEVQTDYLDNSLSLALNSRYGEVRMNNIPIPKVAVGALSTYTPFKAMERVFNYYTAHQYQPYCTIDSNKVKTFSNRNYDYTLTRSWHVVMQDVDSRRQVKNEGDQLVVLARRPSEKQQDIYISYKSETGKDLEIEIKPASQGSNNHNIKVKTNSKKVSEGDLIMYWDDIEQTPLLQFYTAPDGVLMLNIREDRLRAMYDGQRLVVLAKENRNNTRGICGYMSGEPRDDYLTPKGLMDLPKHFAASYALNDEHMDSETQQLQSEAEKLVYQRKYKYTTILRSDNEWRNNMEYSSSSEDTWDSQNVYRARYYSEHRGQCQLQKQVQFFENHGEICITTTPLHSCQSHCNAGGYRVQAVQVVCRPKLDQEFQKYKNHIRQGQNPQVNGVPHIKQYRVPNSCQA